MLIEESFVDNEVRYRFYLDLPSLKIRKSFESQPLPGARDDYIKQLLNEHRGRLGRRSGGRVGRVRAEPEGDRRARCSTS